MFKYYLIIPIFLGVSCRWSVAINNPNSVADVADIDAMRLAKSQLIRKYMNESIDPCEDFYQFACGNWRTHHPATPKQRITHELFFAIDNFNSILTPLLNNTDDKYTDSEWKVKKFCDSCLNASSLKLSEYRQNMKKLIREFGRMPAVEGEKWQHTNFDWIKVIAEISFKYNIRIIYGYNIHPGSDPTANILGMESYLRFYFQDDSVEYKNKHKANVEKNLKHMLGINTKAAKQAAKEIVDFAVKLWNAHMNSGERQETTFEKMHQKYSRLLDIKKLVNISLGSIPSGIVIDGEPGYVEALGTIMKKTPKHVVANYIFYDLMYNFRLNVTSKQIVSSEECLENTKIHFLPILSNMAYRRSHLNETEENIHRIFQAITKTLQNAFESNQLSWFDDDSREAALEKLHLMKLYIASFEHINFDELYKDLTLNVSDYMENKKSIKSYTARNSRKSLNERRDDKFYEIGDITPSYMITANVVRFPLSHLLSDFLWSQYAPRAFNYGRLGTITGHEIMHGFSGGGRYFNKLGIFIEWIFKDIEEEYEERRQCYYDQYHSFTLDNKPLPQDKSQAENLADNGGLFLAYHTYLRWLVDEARTQEELDLETLPYLNYTNKQLFFIGFSQTWCTDSYTDGWWEMISNGVHSPNEFRGFVPLLNFGEFAKEFNCPSGSPMNPRKKCSIY